VSKPGFIDSIPVRWSENDMNHHNNQATKVTILEEARVPFLSPAFAVDITSVGLLIAEVRVAYKGQLRLTDSPLQVTMWISRLRTVDFTIGYEVRSVSAAPDAKPAVIAETQLAAFSIDEQKLVRLSPEHREYLRKYLR
jgi:acyl-CoA thioester hydrolase